jgi:hypothetical protein
MRKKGVIQLYSIIILAPISALLTYKIPIPSTDKGTSVPFSTLLNR